jgi:hypothetical protein
MSTALARLRWIDIVRQELGDMPSEQAGFILWEHTGFPIFWDGDPQECCRAQLREFKQGRERD